MLDQEDFFSKYNVKKYFEQSDIMWNTLEEIYDDYVNLKEDIFDCCNKLEKHCRDNFRENINIHSIRCRAKNPEHLIEKIIRKKGKEQNRKYNEINKSNYMEIVRDLIGMRILILSKEEWEGVFDRLNEMFSNDKSLPIHMAEPPIAYTRYGDRDIFKQKISKEHSNKGYRSQHYVVKFNNFYCEIQVRTLAEELYGEFDHMVKYPYRDDNNFLLRYTNTISCITDSIDEMISTCFQMKEQGWDICNEYFDKDEYLDWKKISQANSLVSITKIEKDRDNLALDDEIKSYIDISEYANNILLRKE